MAYLEMAKHLLVLGAFAPEIDELRHHFHVNKYVHVYSCGIGLVAASVNAANIISSLRAHCRNEELNVLFVGSVGAVDNSVPLFSAVSATESILADSSVLLGKAFFPELLTTRLSSDEELSLNFLSKDRNTYFREPVYSTTSITSDVRNAQLISQQTNAYYENLELFGVAEACRTHNVKWASLSIVTNHVGPDGHKQWQDNFQKAAKVSAEIVKKKTKAILDDSRDVASPLI